MPAPTRPAAAVLALGLTLTLVLAGPTASGAPTGPAPRTATREAPSRAVPVHVHVSVRKHAITRSRSNFRPGNTVFDLRSGGGRGAIQLVRFRPGYSIHSFYRDAAGDGVASVRRLDRRVVFLGGMPVGRHGTTHFATFLAPGRYHLLDFDRRLWVDFRVADGPPRRAPLPRTSGTVNMVERDAGHRFGTPGHLARSGWLRQTNRTDEPHFTDLGKVRRSTTRRQVRRFFASDGDADPSWALDDGASIFVISPGHTVVSRYAVSRGKYLAVCFWPDDEDGTPHAAMGMFGFVHVR